MGGTSTFLTAVQNFFFGYNFPSYAGDGWEFGWFISMLVSIFPLKNTCWILYESCLIFPGPRKTNFFMLSINQQALLIDKLIWRIWRQLFGPKKSICIFGFLNMKKYLISICLTNCTNKCLLNNSWISILILGYQYCLLYQYMWSNDEFIGF